MREIWNKGVDVTMTSTFDPRFPFSIGFDPMRYANIQQKTHRNLCIRSAQIMFTNRQNHRPHRQTAMKNITPLRFHGGLTYRPYKSNVFWFRLSQQSVFVSIQTTHVLLVHVHMRFWDSLCSADKSLIWRFTEKNFFVTVLTKIFFVRY